MDKQIIRQLLINGKSTISEKIWLKSLKLFYKSFAKNHIKAITRAVINTTPLIKVKQLKQKRKKLQLKEFPYIVNKKNWIPFSLKFLLSKTKKEKKIKMYQKLMTELVNVAKKSGGSISKRKSLYEYAFLKKKYFFYRWF
jgi:ribosomal protein S7